MSNIQELMRICAKNPSANDCQKMLITAADYIDGLESILAKNKAAPDMYEVLQSIINTWDGPLYRHEMAPNIDKARKALAKARGEL